MSLVEVLQKGGSTNRALRQLYRGRQLQKGRTHSHSQGPRLSNLLCHNQLQLEVPAVPEGRVRPPRRNSSTASRSNYFLLVQNQQARSGPAEVVIHRHDSFSSYLLKSKTVSAAPKARLRYFDLDEIAHQMASPKPLENKLEQQNKAHYPANLQQCQIRLRNLERQSARYHDNEDLHPRVDSHSRTRHSTRTRQFNRLGPTDQSHPEEDLRPWKNNEEDSWILTARKGKTEPGTPPVS